MRRRTARALLIPVLALWPAGRATEPRVIVAFGKHRT